MANTDKSISYIKIGEVEYPFDAVTVGGKGAEEIGDLVTSISAESTDSQYPSAKCIYNIVYGNNTPSQL